MKKYENKEEKQNAFLNLDVIENSKNGKFTIVEKNTPRPAEPKKKNKTYDLWIVTVLGSIILTVALVFLLLGLFGDESMPTVADPLEEESEEEWKGAFSDEQTYEKCRESTVGIRFGRGINREVRSGFVYDSGLIATSLGGSIKGQRGRLYVMLSDGSEYAVESIREDSESGLSLLKISEEEVTKTVFREEKAVVGEKIFAIAAGREGFDVISGEITSEAEGKIGLNIMLGRNGVGAPIFDENGSLLGIACECDDGERIYSAITSESAENYFSSVEK